MKTFLLDQVAWDIVLDSGGNFAIALDPYALAQDVQSAVRTFLGEVFYNTTLGIPYFDKILGQRPSVSFLVSQLEAAALTVPGVIAASVTLTSFANRKITGYILITDQLTNTNQVFF